MVLYVIHFISNSCFLDCKPHFRQSRLLKTNTTVYTVLYARCPNLEFVSLDGLKVECLAPGANGVYMNRIKLVMYVYFA